MAKNVGFTGWLRVLTLLLITYALTGCGHTEDTHPGQPVTKRKIVFKTMLRSLEPMGLMVRGRKPYDQAEFLQEALKLQSLSTQPWQYFTPDSNYSPTRAKPDVWDKPAEFKQAQQKFVAAAAQLANSAKTGNLDAIRHDFPAVESSCKACHQQFRGIPH